MTADLVREGSFRFHDSVDPQCIEQRAKQVLVGPPAADRVAINGTANLCDARRLHRSLRLVERQAAVLPLEAAVGNQSAGLPFQIGDDILVAYLDHDAFRQDRLPITHQCLIGPIVAAELGEVVGVWLVITEQQRKARQTGVDRVAASVDDASTWQSKMNEADIDEVRQQLVGDARDARGSCADTLDVASTQAAHIIIWKIRNEFRKVFGDARKARHGLGEIVNLSGAEHAGMARQDLLQQCRA